MDLVRHLRYFLVVAEELHFGRAAARLYMSQPPLSQRIRRLEQEYGVQLFDRSGGQVRLTPAGEVLVGEARDVLARVDRAGWLVRQAAAGRAGPLRVGVPPDTPGSVVAALAAAVATNLPDLHLDLRAATTTEQLHLLGHGGLDVGVLQHPVDTGDLVLGPVAEVPQGVVLSRRSPLAERTELTLADLAGHGLMLFPREAAPGLYDETIRVCGRYGFRPTRVRPAPNAEFLVGMVAAGDDVAFDGGTVAQKEPRVVWRPLAGTPLVWRLSAAWPAAPAHPAAPRLGAVIAQILSQGARPAAETTAPPADQPWDVLFRPRLTSA